MKKLSIILAVLSCAPVLFAQQAPSLDKQVQRAVLQALSLGKNEVLVNLKFAKPVYMSDLMLRRPRVKDMVIRVDYTQKSCRGVLDQSGDRVYVPVNCVKQDGYKVADVQLTFANGTKVKKTGTSIEKKGDVAQIYL